MGSSVDRAVSAAGAALDFSSKNWRALAESLVKIYLIEWGLFLVLGILIAAVAFVAIGGAASQVLEPAPAIVLLIVGLLIVGLPLMIFSRAVNLVSFRAVDSIERGKGGKVPIIDGAKEMLVPVAVYSALVIGIVLGTVAVLGGLGVLLIYEMPIAVFVALPLLAVIIIILILAVSFFIQFAPLEIALGKAGGLEAVMRSVSLVRRNIAVTFIFDVIVFGISLAVGIAFSIVTQMLGLAFSLAALIPGLFIALFALMMAVYFVQALAIGILMVPLMYRFWKELGGVK